MVTLAPVDPALIAQAMEGAADHSAADQSGGFPQNPFAAHERHRLDFDAFSLRIAQRDGVRAKLEAARAWRPDAASTTTDYPTLTDLHAWMASGFGLGDLWNLYHTYAASDADAVLERFKADARKLRRAGAVMREAADLIRWSLELTRGYGPLISGSTAETLFEASQILAPTRARIEELLRCFGPAARISVNGYSGDVERIADKIAPRRGRPSKSAEKRFALEWATTAKLKTGRCLDEAGCLLHAIVFDRDEPMDIGDYVKLREGRNPQKSGD